LTHLCTVLEDFFWLVMFCKFILSGWIAYI
jgi:hypothetical protein